MYFTVCLHTAKYIHVELTKICETHSWLHTVDSNLRKTYLTPQKVWETLIWLHTDWLHIVKQIYRNLFHERYIYKNIDFAVWRYEIPSMSFGRAWVCVCVCVYVRRVELRNPRRFTVCPVKIHSLLFTVCTVKIIGLLHSLEIWNPHTYSNTISMAIQYHSIDSIDISLLRKMTYKDKGSYESSPPCIYSRYWVLL